LYARELGMTVVLAERDELGGTCLNRGCVPTKALLRAGDLYREIGEAAAFGVSVAARSFDYASIHARKDSTVSGIRKGLDSLVAASGATIVRGEATICAAGRVAVASDCAGDVVSIEAKYVLIATGCVPAVPPIPGTDNPRVFMSDTLLSFPEFLRAPVIIGGGVIGMEFASFLSDMGSAVTVIEAAPRILPLMDREISQNLSMIMKKRGVAIFAGAKVLSIEALSSDLPLSVAFESGNEIRTVPADGVLVATGRKPDMGLLFADGFDVEQERGFIKVDASFMTSVPGVYAAGDITGRFQLAHAATAQGIAAVAHMAGLLGLEAPVHAYREDAIPACVYTSPEIASVGMTEEGAKNAGVSCVAGKALALANARSVIQSPERGFLKIVCEAQSGKVIGAQMMCERASDLVSELSLAISIGLTACDLASSVRAHPTFSEMITTAAKAAQRLQSRASV
jgi:dihydrolipoamide dehydrogenase